ncbi:hypothetical protein CITRIK5_60046 [Citricoccus sp. K5]|nr:hypothetical protein CITRIK5_60046 [Citricoccus sp. K5]
MVPRGSAASRALGAVTPATVWSVAYPSVTCALGRNTAASGHASRHPGARKLTAEQYLIGI